ncbi:hypothetical protein AMS68_001905 [Peltaster fructicola]|uniref:Uncharacterized protein n=1 Tax=Peltaster fructicola TaxID=286661 RepID=A0A6H0XP33_9PEZI|nr:hypothetical protein AMS68_001905 [Peltaster fructicola]
MLRRRPPSGYHWCRVGYRVSNPDEIELDNDIINTVLSEPTADEAGLHQASSKPVADEAGSEQAEVNVASLAQKKEVLTSLVPSLTQTLPPDDVLAPDDADESEAYEPEEYYDEHEEEDDLGYYPDGVKRTLTDEQIAIFRHTELQMIERRRQRELNNDRNAKPSAMEAAYFLDDDEVQPRPKAKPQTGAQPPASTTIQRVREEVPYDQRKKRKWEGYIEHKDPVQGSMTHRRLARELDAQESGSIDMDYGDDTPSDVAPERLVVPPSITTPAAKQTRASTQYYVKTCYPSLGPVVVHSDGLDLVALGNHNLTHVSASTILDSESPKLVGVPAILEGLDIVLEDIALLDLLVPTLLQLCREIGGQLAELDNSIIQSAQL